MSKRVTIVRGHPDSAATHLVDALATSYAAGAAERGHEVREIVVAKLDFPIIRIPADFEHGVPPPEIAEAQRAIAWAQHIAIFFPLWLGEEPALLKAFFEQVFRPTFGDPKGRLPALLRKPLRGRSARLVVTMGMPAFLYRFYFGAHGVKNLERNVLRFAGFAPVRATFFGGVEGAGEAKRGRWIAAMRELGRRAR